MATPALYRSAVQRLEDVTSSYAFTLDKKSLRLNYPDLKAHPCLTQPFCKNISETSGWGQDAAVLLTTGQRVRV